MHQNERLLLAEVTKTIQKLVTEQFYWLGICCTYDHAIGSSVDFSFNLVDPHMYIMCMVTMASKAACSTEPHMKPSERTKLCAQPQQN